MLTVLENRYKILRALGSGGFGETFLAEDTHMPSNRRCVIKQLKPITNDPQVYQIIQDRFKREAVILENLGETNRQIPSLYAYFEENSQFYLVQEYIEGVTLTQKIEQEKTLSESSVREILTGILPVLEFIHSQGIVHRDIKPDNIILRHSDHLPVLIDFGAVKETMGTKVTASGNTTSSIVIGTPGFMPSEQAVGRPVYNSDLYSLGITAIYLLTGKIPQELKSDPATGSIIWRQFAPNVSPSLATIIDKAIQTHPRDRFTNAKEMLDALYNRLVTVTPTVPISQPTIPTPPVYQTSPTVPTIPPTTPSYPPSTPNTKPPTPTEVSTSPKDKQNNNSGLAEWQKAVITGSIIGVFVVGGLFLIQPKQPDNKEANSGNNTQQPTPQPTPQPTQTPDYSTPQPTPPSTPTYTPPAAKISQDEAVNLVKQWQSAKKEIFAPPFNRQLGSELLTGKAFQDNITKYDGTESSVDWLQNNNSYYNYGVQSLDSIEKFAASGDQATIDVVITEQRTLYDNQGKIDPDASGFDQRLVRYNLQLDGDKWKISDYNTIRIISRR